MITTGPPWARSPCGPWHTRPGTWREKVRSWAHEDLRSYREHPWLIELTATGQPVGPHAFAWTDSALRIFEDTGLTAHEALTVVETVEGYIRGHAAKVVRADRSRERTTPDGRTWNTVQEAFLVTRAGEAGRYRAIERLDTDGPDPDEVFAQGLEWLLDGVESRVRTASESGKSY